MIKLLGLIAKRPDLTDEQFHAHWRGTHKDLALRITELRRYVQSHRVPVAVPGVPSSPYEGIAEVWLDDVATARGLADDPEYTEHARLDEPNFSDTDRHGVIVAGEHVVRPGPPVAQDARGAKLMLLLRRADGVGPEGFAEAMTALAPRLAHQLADARRVVLTIPVEESYGDGAGPPYDAVLEATFTDTAAFERSWASAAGALVGELDAVAERSASCALIVEELRVLWP